MNQVGKGAVQLLTAARGGEMVALHFNHEDELVEAQSVPRGSELGIMMRRTKMYLWKSLGLIVESPSIQPHINHEKSHNIKSLWNLAQRSLVERKQESFLRSYNIAAEIVKRDIDDALVQHPDVPHLQLVADYLTWRPNHPSQEEGDNVVGRLYGANCSHLSLSDIFNELSRRGKPTESAPRRPRESTPRRDEEMEDLKRRVSDLEKARNREKKERVASGIAAGVGIGLGLGSLGFLASTKLGWSFVFSSAACTTAFVTVALAVAGAVGAYCIVVYALPKLFGTQPASTEDPRPVPAQPQPAQSDDVDELIHAISQSERINLFEDTRG